MYGLAGIQSILVFVSIYQTTICKVCGLDFKLKKCEYISWMME